jgi:trk system potassium uptake protein TrkA
MAERVAGTLVTTGALAGLELDGGQVLVELQTPKEFVGKTLAEIDVRRRWGVSVVAFLTLAEERTILGRKRQTRKQVSPDPQRRIEADDILLVIGDQKSINEMTG